MVSRVIRELLAQWVALVFVGQRATVVCRAPRVTLDSKDLRATRAMSVSVGHQAQVAFLAHLVLRVLLDNVDLSVLLDVAV
jgi:hypothetical protein